MCQQLPVLLAAAVVPRVVAAPPREGGRAVDAKRHKHPGRSPGIPEGAHKAQGADRNRNNRGDARRRDRGVAPSRPCLLEPASSTGMGHVRKASPVPLDTRNPGRGRPARLATAAAGIDNRVRTIEPSPEKT